jgi:hypothetical protein
MKKLPAGKGDGLRVLSIQVSLSPDEKASLQEEARSRGVTVSRLVWEILKEELKWD